jgi:hypothetical protein
MRQLRQVILWAVLAAIGLLILLSAVGALCGDEKARALFNSWPLVAFWFLCLALLAAGFASFRRLITAPAGVLMHLGAVLIIAGAMWGSQRGHEWRARLFDSPKVASGIMPIMKGDAEGTVFNGAHEPIAELPFSLYLKDFWIEYWPAKEKEWLLILVSPGLDEQGQMTRFRERITWKKGEEILLPDTDVRMKVLRYLEHARPTFAEGAKPRLTVTDAAGNTLGDLAAEAGAEVALKAPPLSVEVVKVFQNLRVLGAGAGREVIDDVGHGENPGLQVRVSDKEGVIWEGYVLPQMPGQARPAPEAEPLTLQYILPGPTGAEEDPSSPSPAMELQLTCNGREANEWLLPEPGERLAQLSLAPLAAAGPEGRGMGRMMAPELYLVQPQGSVKAYKSDVVILENNRKADEAVIEVNHPLHWGGYHFYQADWDHENETYTVLSVSSDSGLAAAYLGMAILSLGAFWRFWGEAAWAWIKQAGHGS